MKCRHVLSLSVVCALLVWGASTGAQETGQETQETQETLFSSLYAVENGDINGDGGRDVGDAIGLLEWLYLGGPTPVAMACKLEAPAVENGDVNGNGDVDMPAADRLVLTLRHFEGLSTQETARVLGIRRNAAAKRYVRAIHRLRAMVNRAAEA